MSEIKFTEEEQIQLLEALDQFALAKSGIAKLSNVKIGELIFYHIWANMEPLSPQSQLILAAIDRLGFIVPNEENEQDFEK